MTRSIMRLIKQVMAIAIIMVALILLTRLDLHVAHWLTFHPFWLGGAAGVLLGIAIVVYLGSL
jgi:predicted membrane chloride channel (bestrophin family)